MCIGAEIVCGGVTVASGLGPVVVFHPAVCFPPVSWALLTVQVESTTRTESHGIQEIGISFVL